jgi:hypothetical protein
VVFVGCGCLFALTVAEYLENARRSDATMLTCEGCEAFSRCFAAPSSDNLIAKVKAGS